MDRMEVKLEVKVLDTSSSFSSSDESNKPNQTSEKHLVCSYNGCNASFSKNSRLIYHIRKHTGERPYVCDEPSCGKSYVCSFHLRRHKNTYHLKNPTDNRVLCLVNDCGREFANKYSLKKHIKIKHDPDRKFPFSCDECNLGFLKKKQFLMHTYVHTGILPFKCEKCGARFLTERDCKRHSRTHTTYTCSCQKVFERWAAFLKHRKEECPDGSIKCKLCSKTFLLERSLRSHETKHAIKKIYMCSYDNCTRQYLHIRNLKYHINKFHKGITRTRIKCTECDASFTRKQTLDFHIDRCHALNPKAPIEKRRKTRKDKGVKRKFKTEPLTDFIPCRELSGDVLKDIPNDLPLLGNGNIEISKRLLIDIEEKNVITANVAVKSEISVEQTGETRDVENDMEQKESNYNGNNIKNEYSPEPNQSDNMPCFETLWLCKTELIKEEN